ncbi:stage II sporulation protein M [Cerasibacillus sp. JNUCC 74]
MHTPGLELTLDLFTNNITICLLLLLGIVTFGIPTLFYLLLNGFVLGIGVNDLISIGIPLNEFFMKLLPHAILEIPAFILSGAIGLYGFTFYLGYRIQIRPFLNYTIIIITMISLAAFIEGYISTSF